MQTKKYVVTNPTSSYICMMGLRRLEIPALCKDLVIELADTSAKKVIGRLRAQHPYLKIAEYKEPVKAAAPVQEVKAPVQEKVEEAKADKSSKAANK